MRVCVCVCVYIYIAVGKYSKKLNCIINSDYKQIISYILQGNMVRHPKRKYNTVGNDKVKDALKKLREGHSLREVGKEFEIPKSTLHLYSTKSKTKKKKISFKKR